MYFFVIFNEKFGLTRIWRAYTPNIETASVFHTLKGRSTRQKKPITDKTVGESLSEDCFRSKLKAV